MYCTNYMHVKNCKNLHRVLLGLCKLLDKVCTRSFLNVHFQFSECDFPPWHSNLHYLSFYLCIIHPYIRTKHIAFGLCTKVNWVRVFHRPLAPPAQVTRRIILPLS